MARHSTAWCRQRTVNLHFDTRINEIYVDPNLIGKVVIGEEGMSVIVYSFTDDRFEIRDKVSSDYVIESHTHFNGLLSALIEPVS